MDTSLKKQQIWFCMVLWTRNSWMAMYIMYLEESCPWTFDTGPPRSWSLDFNLRQKFIGCKATNQIETLPFTFRKVLNIFNCRHELFFNPTVIVQASQAPQCFLKYLYAYDIVCVCVWNKGKIWKHQLQIQGVHMKGVQLKNSYAIMIHNLPIFLVYPPPNNSHKWRFSSGFPTHNM